MKRTSGTQAGSALQSAGDAATVTAGLDPVVDRFPELHNELDRRAIDIDRGYHGHRKTGNLVRLFRAPDFVEQRRTRCVTNGFLRYGLHEYIQQLTFGGGEVP